ncbi:hypothetical protein [Motilibacter deserti]|uniref:Uncharacterized protein n=1 Tax=Motilibacter deserti TaxID=2714956 RepID=A0ABX0GPA4_9ACTN|nr:hypothetical protein [Motilibacter deserti]NHC12673.1 hypothetical protein [Motilibacter deserti]
MTVTVPGVADVHLRLRADVPHTQALVVLWAERKLTFAVTSANGDVLALPGWFDAESSTPTPRPLDEHRWDEERFTPVQAVHYTNGPWLAGELGSRLSPTYIPAVHADELLREYPAAAVASADLARAAVARVVAYVPVVRT